MAAGLALLAGAAHAMASAPRLALGDTALVTLMGILYMRLRYPRRWTTRIVGGMTLVGGLLLATIAFQRTMEPALAWWSLAGAVSAAAMLGSMNLAMILGHWYLVVRGMPIAPLQRLTLAILGSSLLRVVVVAAALLVAASSGSGQGSPLHQILVRDGIFFWMRIGWGLLAPLALYPLIHGTVKIRSTMAATGILYVGVVAVIIGEVIGGYLATRHHLPL